MELVRVEWEEDRSLMHDPTAYLTALPGLAQHLPPGARAFAQAPAHYDFCATECVKDLWLDSITHDLETATAVLRFNPNQLKHGGGLTIEYVGVSRLDRDGEDGAESATAPWSLRLDEVLPAPGGVSHELRCLEGTILVVAADLVATWDVVTP